MKMSTGVADARSALCLLDWTGEGHDEGNEGRFCADFVYSICTITLLRGLLSKRLIRYY
jgi:hypothetical protein